MNTIMDHLEADILDLEAGFLENFPAQSIFRGLGILDLPPGNTPEVRPFSGANHEDLASGVKQQGPDRDDGMQAIPRAAHQFPPLPFENFPKLPQMFDD